VGAVGANGKEFITAADQNQFFVVGLASDHAAITNSRIGNPFLKSGLFVSGVSAMICLASRSIPQ
jgi:hypothetical protein